MKLLETEWENYYDKGAGTQWHVLLSQYKELVRTLLKLGRLEILVPPPPHRDQILTLPRDEIYARTVTALFGAALSYHPRVTLCIELTDTGDRTLPREPVHMRPLLKLLAKKQIPLSAMVMRQIRLDPKDLRYISAIDSITRLVFQNCDYWVPNDQIKYTITDRTFKSVQNLTLEGAGVAQALSGASFPRLTSFKLVSPYVPTDARFDLPDMPTLRRLEGPDWVLARYLEKSYSSTELTYLGAIGNDEDRTNNRYDIQLVDDRHKLAMLLHRLSLANLKILEFERCNRDWLADFLKAWSKPAMVAVGWLKPGSGERPLYAPCLQVARKAQLRTTDLAGLEGLSCPLLEAAALPYTRHDYDGLQRKPVPWRIHQRAEELQVLALQLRAPLYSREASGSFTRECLEQFALHPVVMLGQAT